MKTRAMVLLVAAMMISATTSVNAADSMKHDMQSDIHIMLGMATDEVKDVQPPQETTIVSFMKHDMQSDMHVKLGMTADDSKVTVTKFKSSTDPNNYRQ